MKCPKCDSSNVVHKDHDHGYEQSNHIMKHYAAHQSVHALQGHPAMFLIAAGGWLTGKVVQKLKKPWTCKNCDHAFD
jgi:hypothetical protein